MPMPSLNPQEKEEEDEGEDEDERALNVAVVREISQEMDRLTFNPAPRFGLGEWRYWYYGSLECGT